MTISCFIFYIGSSSVVYLITPDAYISDYFSFKLISAMFVVCFVLSGFITGLVIEKIESEN